jgi:hypothetical protein
VQLFNALNPRRIARSLVTILGLTLIQTILPPVLAPEISAPKAEAVDISYASFPGGTDVQVPSGATSVTITVRGGAGGTGGSDGGTSGLASSDVGYITAEFPVTAGDRLLLYPGGAGSSGSTGGSAAGGTGGPKSNPMPAAKSTSYKINGTWGDAYNFNGGTGGATGSYGSSGSGGGGGAASFVALNDSILAVAGGGGGGGGAGNGSANAPVANPNYTANGTSAVGASGATPTSCGTNLDGGGGGGGGGGWYGGAGGAATVPSGGSECSGTGGSRGGNHVASNATNSTNSTTSPNGAGFITYVFNYAATTDCVTDIQTNDIYTIVKVTSTTRCTWSIPSTVSVVDLFLVGGGAGGAGDAGGGGGGGAILSRTAVVVTPSTALTLKAGFGGAPSNWGFPSDALNGDSTTVTTSAGVTYYALGGSRSASGNLPGGVGGLGGVATNGGFSGGAGGAGGACYSVGSSGKTGVTNYYYPSVVEYGGGGGGGTCPNGAATTAPAGVSGGGSGGYASSATVNQPGTDGLAGRGGGGGGGVATGSGMKLPGGKGGSGVILIRYATNSINAFPASLASSVAAHYSPGDLQLLDSTRKGWVDSSGNTASVGNASITATGLSVTKRGASDSGYSTGSSKELLVVKGGTSSSITLTNLATGYTLYHVARYSRGGTANKIFTTSGNDWTSGFYWGETVGYHYNWLTDDRRSLTYNWQITGDQSKVLRAGGIDVTRNDSDIGTQLASVNNFGINNYNSPSDFEVSDIIIFNRELTMGEMRLFEEYLARINGMTLSPFHDTSETDTAYLGTSTYSYMFEQTDARNNLSDTFTVEAWVKPSTVCNTNVCTLMARENSYRFVVRNGKFGFILWGDGTWQWVYDVVSIPADEWHHIAISKTLAGNNNNSVKVWLDGQLVYTKGGSPYRTSTTPVASPSNASTLAQVTTWGYIGVITGGGERWYGNVDEIKVWRGPRTTEEIKQDMYSNDGSHPDLQKYYNMNYVPGTHVNQYKVPNLAYYGHNRSDLFNWDSDVISFSDVKTVTSSAPYTTVTFPRAYITQYGGWKVPESMTAATTIVVGGGGGGGFGSATNRPAGGGGGGGVTASLTQSYAPGTIVPITVGVGGLGGFAADDPSVRNGSSSYVGVGAGLTALGGGGGGNNGGNGAGGSTVATGGGSGASDYVCTGTQPTAVPGSGTFVPGATVTSGYNGGGGIWGWGGSGGGARGAAQNGTCNGSNAGLPGDGFFDPITNVEYGRGGSATSYSTTSAITGNTTQNNGWGGVISYNGGNSTGVGYRGSMGTVVIRYITATKPTYTAPTNAYLNVGMTETFTTNVAVDSATVGLTRTFRWESSTTGSNGTFSVIKQGTGTTNAAFSWVPSDTSTSGNQFVYRVIVTDTDTAGLRIIDTSTPVFAVINKTLLMSGVSTIKKQINVARSETFTISDGTPGYRYTLSPTIPGVSIDTSTVGTTVLKISDTASVGTYLETLTVIDSVSATVVIPITLVISAPPNLVNSSQPIENDLVFNIDMSNSASYSRSTGTISDISGTKKQVTINGGATFSDDYAGNLALSTSQYISATGFTTLPTFTIEAYVNLKSISTGQVCVFGSEQSSTNVPYFICIDTGRTVFTGFYNGSWTYKRSTEALVLGAWTHIVGTFNPNASADRTELYLNGVKTTLWNSSEGATLVPPAADNDKIVINKWFNVGNTPTSAMNIGYVRLYRSSFDQAKVTQNYNATKDRFASTNLNQLMPSQKYGTLNLESFTVTSGGDTKTVTFAVGNRTGIRWDTATAGVVNLSVQESLTPGIYYDTITVTDNFAQSTSLPIKFTVSKADTITVIAGATTSQVYNKLPATALPSFTITGLVASDTGTVLRKYTGVDWTKPCAQGGGCEVGDTGPGGGTIFYISPTVIDSATGISGGGTYLEVAPKNWWGTNNETTTAWAKAATSVTGTSSAIGKGAENTRLINTALTTNSVAAKLAADLTFGGKSDWFLPSTLEVKEMYDALYAPGLAGGLSVTNYWSSTQGTDTAQADTYWFGSGGLVSTTNKVQSYTLRPIRAYSPDTITVTTTPTNVDSYTVAVDTITMITGSLSYYENVILQTSGLNLTKARQDSLTVTSYVGNFGTPFTLTVLGGSGTGAYTESFTAGSTATGCAVSGHVVTSTTAGTCVLQMKKAYSRNYFTETTTATLYLLQWITNQPSPSAGTGPTIALGGQTSIFRDPNVAPMISSLSVYTAQAGITQVVITGAGFNHLDPASITVKFWRNKIASGFTVSADDTQITVTVPVGSTTGKVLVTTPNGSATSALALTITP